MEPIYHKNKDPKYSKCHHFGKKYKEQGMRPNECLQGRDLPLTSTFGA